MMVSILAPSMYIYENVAKIVLCSLAFYLLAPTYVLCMLVYPQQTMNLEGISFNISSTYSKIGKKGQAASCPHQSTTMFAYT